MCRVKALGMDSASQDCNGVLGTSRGRTAMHGKNTGLIRGNTTSFRGRGRGKGRGSVKDQCYVKNVCSVMGQPYIVANSVLKGHVSNCDSVIAAPSSLNTNPAASFIEESNCQDAPHDAPNNAAGASSKISNVAIAPDVNAPSFSLSVTPMLNHAVVNHAVVNSASTNSNTSVRKKRPPSLLKKRMPLLEINSNISDQCKSGGVNNSANKDIWARNRFDAWRVAVGRPVDMYPPEMRKLVDSPC